VESLPVWKFFTILSAHLAAAFLLRHMLLGIVIRPYPVQRQSTRLFFLDYALFAGSGIGVGLFNRLILGFPLISSVEMVLGFVTVGLLPALDLSLEWEYRIIRQASGQDHDQYIPQSFFPQTRKFAFLACGIIVFVTIVLLALMWRDISWLTNQSQSAAVLSDLFRSIIYEILFVMGIFLGLTLVVVFSYARNLKLLFGNQTTVLELVTQGQLETKVPVVTNDEFAIIAGHTNVMIDHLIERERMFRGLELARQIQANLLPRSSPLLPGVQIFGSSHFSDETGGDFYDYMVRDGEDGPELVVLVGDVSGHGVGSALLMTSIRAYIKAHLFHIADLAKVMKYANMLICRDVAGSGYFATVFLFSYAPASRRARWVSAGHDPGVYQTFERSPCVELKGKDIPLGVGGEWNYTQFSSHLEPGVLLLGTDGVWEAMNSDKAMFGKDRLHQMLRDHLHSSPQEMASCIFSEVEAFTGTAQLEDDRTLVIARFE
jgi:sigma-B regulation protein RsbU (phosphoserine phosphatase)